MKNNIITDYKDAIELLSNGFHLHYEENPNPNSPAVIKKLELWGSVSTRVYTINGKDVSHNVAYKILNENILVQIRNVKRKGIFTGCKIWEMPLKEILKRFNLNNS